MAVSVHRKQRLPMDQVDIQGDGQYLFSVSLTAFHPLYFYFGLALLLSFTHA